MDSINKPFLLGMATTRPNDSDSISEQGARKAQSLVRRLAAEKQRKKALDTSATDSPMPEAVRNIANEERCQRREQKARIGDTQPGKAQRCPWRVGGPSETWGEERCGDGETPA